MPKVQIQNYKYSPLKKENVGHPKIVDCEIVKLTKNTAEVYVPRIGKTLKIKRWKLLEDDKNNIAKSSTR